MVGWERTLLVLCLATCLGWTWPAQEDEIQLRGSAGWTFSNHITNVKGSGPTDTYNFSDFPMQNGIAVSGGLEWFTRPWLSLRLEGQYRSHNVEQFTGIMTDCQLNGVEGYQKGWKGKEISIRPSLVLHTPAWHGLHLYGGGGPVFTMSSLCDWIGCTESHDWNMGVLGGLQAKLIGPVSGFVEYRHTQGYMDCVDAEGCYRGRRYSDALLFGVSLSVQWADLVKGLTIAP